MTASAGRGAIAANGRLGRRLLLVFALAAMLPVGIAGLLTWQSLSSNAAQQESDHLRGLAKSAGMSLFSQLSIAASQLRGIAGGLPASVADASSFTGIERLPRSESPASRGLPALTALQEQRLATGHTILAWNVAGAGRDGQLYLARMTGDGRQIVFGAVNGSKLLDEEAGVSQQLEVRVTDLRGQLLIDRRFADSNAVARDAREQWPSADWQLYMMNSFSADTLRISVAQPIQSTGDVLADVRIILPLTLAGALVLALLLGTTQLRRMLAPLETLAAAARAFSVRRFDTPVTINTGDELAQLGTHFNRMAASLSEQFSALETMADIDRLLLGSPNLEQILDALLPRVAQSVHCTQVAVLLHDRDAEGYGRIYRYLASPGQSLPLQRVATDRALLTQAFAGHELLTLRSDADPTFEFLRPLWTAPDGCIDIWPLRHAGQLLGSLCLVRSSHAGSAEAGDHVGRARGFADRLAVALANLSHVEQLHQQANFDGLTGLVNRQLFRHRVEQSLRDAADRGRLSALLYIDLDQFKRVNDSAGHGAGDQLLEQVAQRLQASVQRDDTVARLGGDEFAIILQDVPEAATASAAAERLLRSIEQPCIIDGKPYQVSASVGIARIPRDGDSVELLLRNGDIAMYRAKEAGRGRWMFFSPEMHTQLQQRQSLEEGLRSALKNGEFRLLYQPVVAGTRIVGCEALIRWTRADGTEVGPMHFIPVAEETGLIVPIGEWVLQQACRDFLQWQANGLQPGYVSVNVAPRQLLNPGFVARLRRMLSEQQMPTSMLQLELTESAVADANAAERVLNELCVLGVRLALDDFGTGYSSLSHLHRFPFDVVKIDGSFVRELTTSRVAHQLVKASIQMANSLDLPVIAEGVQTEAQRDMLQRMDCDALQGYLFSRPVTAAAFAAQLAAPPWLDHAEAPDAGSARRRA